MRFSSCERGPRLFDRNGLENYTGLLKTEKHTVPSYGHYRWADTGRLAGMSSL